MKKTIVINPAKKPAVKKKRTAKRMSNTRAGYNTYEHRPVIKTKKQFLTIEDKGNNTYKYNPSSIITNIIANIVKASEKIGTKKTITIEIKLSLTEVKKLMKEFYKG